MGQGPHRLDGAERGPGRVVLPDLRGRDGRDDEQLGAGVVIELSAAGRQLPDPATGRRQVVPQLPVEPQHPEEVRQGRDVVLEVPPDRLGQVALVGSEEISPVTLGGVRTVRRLAELEEEAGVPSFHIRAVSALGEMFHGHHSDGLEHPEPGDRARGVDDHEAVAHEPSSRSSTPSSDSPVTAAAASIVQPSMNTPIRANMSRSSSSSRSTLHSTCRRSVLWRSGRSTGPAAERVEAPLEAFEQRRRVHQADTGGCSSMASGRPSRRRQMPTTASTFSLGQGEVVADGRRTVDEQADRGQGHQVLDRPASGVAGTGSPATGYSRSARNRRRSGSIARMTTPDTAQAAGPAQVRAHHLLDVVEHEQRDASPTSSASAPAASRSHPRAAQADAMAGMNRAPAP